MTVHNFLRDMVIDKWYKIPSNDNFQSLDYYSITRFGRNLIRNGNKIKVQYPVNCNNCGCLVR